MTFLPPGKRTIMSGVSREPSAETDSFKSKSQVLEHSGRLDYPAQLQFSPLASHVGRTQRLHQPPGLRLQHVLRQLQRFELLGQRRRRADAILLDLLELAVHVGERFLQRLDHLVDRALAPFEIEFRRLLEFAERRSRQLEEGLIVPAEGFGRERRERITQLDLGLLNQRELLGGAAAFGSDLGLETRALVAGVGEGFLGPGQRGLQASQLRLHVLGTCLGGRHCPSELRPYLGGATLRLCMRDEPGRGHADDCNHQEKDGLGKHQTKFRRKMSKVPALPGERSPTVTHSLRRHAE